MPPNDLRLLYLDGYTVPKGAAASSSDAIGYGITGSAAIQAGLQARGFDVRRPRTSVDARDRTGGAARLAWVLATYEGVLEALTEEPPDAILAFHAATTFPAEIRRMLLDLRLPIPMVGYTHGSHWDPTDAFRFEMYPGMEIVDLANLHVLDRILVVSQYMRRTLRENIAALNEPLASRLDDKVVVVGLPLDVDRIDACRGGARSSRTTVVFNHAPVSSKNPELFARVIGRVLARRDDVQVVFTRRFSPEHPGGTAVAALAQQYPDRVVRGDDLTLEEYYEALWSADIQVSTASHESLGVATLEAMYTGNCCVLPRLGSYPEITDDCPDALYELGEQGLEAKLCYFLDHPEQRRAVAARLQRLSAGYHPDVVVPLIADTVLEAVAIHAAR